MIPLIQHRHDIRLPFFWSGRFDIASSVSHDETALGSLKRQDMGDDLAI
jgi:hypothetical protein